MAAIIDHECFPQPNDNNAKVWRYMDVARFLSLISTKKLFFCRIDRFRDTFEGRYSGVNLKMRPLMYKNFIEDKKQLNKWLLGLNEGLDAFRREVYVNCWHMNEHESAAMWDLYGGSQQTVAIRSNYRKLVSGMPETFFAGKVTYVNYDTTLISERNVYYPIMHKRLSFEHESEIRLVTNSRVELEEGEEVVDGVVYTPFGASVPVTLSDIIEEVYVSPDAPRWFFDSIVAVCRRFDLHIPIKHSRLYSTDLF